MKQKHLMLDRTAGAILLRKKKSVKLMLKRRRHF